ncbi:MAG: tetratricopeptide repeat protein [bacterium]
MRFNRGLVPLLVAILVLAGCSQSLYLRGRSLCDDGQHRQAVTTLQAGLQSDAADYRSWCELGVAHFELGEYELALTAQKRSLALQPTARAQLYVGMCYEKLAPGESTPEAKASRYALAREAYRASLGLNPPQALLRGIQARMERLLRIEEIQKALFKENTIDADTIPANTVAVYDFDSEGLPPELAPLAVGLAEFTSLSLTKVKSLQVVERLRVQELLREMEWVKEGKVDASMAPRTGLLLGSSRVVTGWVSNPEAEKVRLGSSIHNTADHSEATPDIEEGKLQRIITLQVAFVYQILKELGVEPTPAEREAIEALPTESYDAFLSFCRGLQFKAEGNYKEAQQQFEAAIAADEGFTEAAVQSEETASLEAGDNLEVDIMVATVETPDLGATLGGLVENTGAAEPSADDDDGGGGGVTDDPPPPPEIPKGSVIVEGTFDGN